MNGALTRVRPIARLIALVLGAAAVACGGQKPPPPLEPQVSQVVADAGGQEDTGPAQKSLYDRLGGKDALKLVVESFVGNLQADPKLKAAFAKTVGPKLDQFKQMLVEMLCEKTGGDCKYSGKSMKDAHKDMKISDELFNAVMADLTLALDEHKVAEGEKTDLFATLSNLRDEVVNVKKPNTNATKK